MTASYTCTDCAIRWVESDGATCPGCARRGEPALPAAVQPWVDAVRAVWPEARVEQPRSGFCDVAIQERPSSFCGRWDAYVMADGRGGRLAGAGGFDWCPTPTDLVAALRKHIPAPSPKPPAAPNVYDCTCSQRNPPGLYCPGCTRLLLDRVSTAVRRLLDEIDRVQRSGRTLVDFPTELLAAVEDVRAALGGDR